MESVKNNLNISTDYIAL